MDEITAKLAQADAVLVTVESTQGSAPREAGAWMVVFADAVFSTIGGGQLEFEAIAQARRRLAGESGQRLQRYPLGPSLGQCCGGAVELGFERITRRDIAALARRLNPTQLPLALFGGGHVSKALVQALNPLPFAITWIDSRDQIFPENVPANVCCEHSDPVQAAVAGLAAGSRVLVMSFSHAEDLDVIAACLNRQRDGADLPYIGLIGSKTKWAVFRNRLQHRGFSDAELAQVTCPIGIRGIAGKQPAVIAASVAAQLLLLAGSAVP